jgi:hypothetical protein
MSTTTISTGAFTIPETPPRLQTTTRGGTETDLAHPAPDVLLKRASPAERKRHRVLIERVVKARTDAAKLRASLEDVARADEEAMAAAVLAGKPEPEPQRPKLEEELARQERVASILRREVVSSAQGVLAAAWEHVDAALLEITEGEDESIDAVRDAVTALEQALATFDERRAERGWIAHAIRQSIGERGSVHAYRPGSDHALFGIGRQTRAAVEQAIEDALRRRDEVERETAFEIADAPKVAAAREEAVRASEARRAMYEGMRRGPVPGTDA